MSCQVCFEKLDEPGEILVPGYHGPTADIGRTYVSQICPADRHDRDKWRALVRMVNAIEHHATDRRLLKLRIKTLELELAMALKR